jgi:hypothetical protein
LSVKDEELKVSNVFRCFCKGGYQNWKSKYLLPIKCNLWL